jgi:hypothetical protein
MGSPEKLEIEKEKEINYTGMEWTLMHVHILCAQNIGDP